MSYFPRTSAEVNATEMRQVVSSSMRLNKLKSEAKQALLDISLNRKKLYDIIVDLKEHFEEYGFKSAAAAVEDVIPRSKRWANMFCADIEAELEIGQVGNSFPTMPDKAYKKEQKALSKVESAREEEPEKPRVKTAPEELAEQAEKNGHAEPAKPKTTENGKPKSQLGVWKKAEDLSGVWVRAVDDVQRACPNKIFHDRVLHHINEAIKLFQEWRQSVR